ncbi:MAG: carboxypeptidase-like regulatory domain-containing protein [Promicromonosporaceae bacterium]|nr:carboxypeptidase-like regulatory domain-containing protein [Promicromonosporaceae bacterium]
MNYAPDAPIDDQDAAVLDSLARALGTLDPVPDGLIERSLFAMTLAALEGEVMSMQEVDTLAGAIRGDTAPVEARTITFTHETLTVMVALSAADSGLVRIDGWLVPAAELVVELRQPDGDRSTTSDQDGRFSFDLVERGPASLLVRPADGGAPVVTPVVEL